MLLMTFTRNIFMHLNVETRVHSLETTHRPSYKKKLKISWNEV